MKSWCFIEAFFVLLLAACSCTDTAPRGICHPDRHLTAIDTLMWQQPDSAFSQLQAFAVSPAMDSLDAFNGHYFHLLLSELLYKNDFAQTNRNELLQAVGYYDSLVVEEGNRVHLDLAFLDARAHYINGVGYYEMDSVVPACEEYLKALEIMEDQSLDNNPFPQFMAMIYTRLMDVFSNRYLHEQTVEFGKKALQYYEKYTAPPRYLAWMLDKIGAHYDMMDMIDSADCYYNKALRVLPDTNNITYRDALAHFAFLQYEMYGSPQEPLSRLHVLLDQSDSGKENAARCMTIGEIFYNEKMYDSAYLYLEWVYNNTLNEELKMRTAQLLTAISREKEDTLQANRYEVMISQFASAGDQFGYMDSKLAKLYYSYVVEHQQRVQDKTTKSIRRLFLWLPGIAIFIGVFIILVSKQKQKKLNQYHAQALQRENLLLEENKALKKQRQIEASKPFYSIHEYDELMQEEICLVIKQSFSGIDVLTTNQVDYYDDLAISQKQKGQLSKAIEVHCPGFTSTLRKLYPKMNASDIECCRFFLIGCTEKEISVLLQLNRSTIWRRANRIKKIMNVNNPSDELKKMFFGKIDSESLR